MKTGSYYTPPGSENYNHSGIHCSESAAKKLSLWGEKSVTVTQKKCHFCAEKLSFGVTFFLEIIISTQKL